LNLDLKFVTIKLTSDQIPALDPILVLILVPIFDQAIYPAIARFRPFRPLPRMACGMVLTAAAFVVAGFLQIAIDNEDEKAVPIYMQLPQYVLLAAGEIMVSITGLEYAYTQAPRTMKSIIMSGWLLTVAFGNLIVVIVAESSVIDDRAVEFFFFSVLMMVAMFLFLLIVYSQGMTAAFGQFFRGCGRFCCGRRYQN